MKRSVLGCLVGCVLVLADCLPSSEECRVSKVKNLTTADEAVWQLRYDAKGRLAAYGDTPVTYGGNEIRIGRMDWEYGDEQLLSAAYFFSRGEVFRSEARCLWLTDGGEVEIWKEVEYQQCGDTVRIESTSYSMSGHRPLRQVFARYVYDGDGNLTEIVGRRLDADRGTSTFHHCYGYGKNIHDESNLCMQAFFVHAEGPDVFFFLLMDMNRKGGGRKLPDHIQYGGSPGESGYSAEGLYYLDGERLFKGEVISTDVKLKVRMEFGYSD